MMSFIVDHSYAFIPRKEDNTEGNEKYPGYVFGSR